MQTDFEKIMAKEEVGFDEIMQLCSQRLEKYDGKSLIEKYALYMGMVQILELQIKQMMYNQFGYTSEKQLENLETMTFGQALNALYKELYRDIFDSLKNTKENRNNMAHSFLVDTMISKSLGLSMESIEVRQLDKYIFELENSILFWEWCVKHEALSPYGLSGFQDSL